ncbi:MAG: hypothetical protein C0592_13435 [Marinilabiliales bacterium]|nr:MAG: hypothetical protein C0592_13435 [Marinilabiliales bacterium]
MTRKSNKSSAYIFQILIGILLIVMFFIDDFESHSTFDYIKLLFGLIIIGIGVFGLVKNKKREDESTKQE